MSSGKILLGVLAGVAVGATLGILFAPDKGSATRKKISTKSDEYADELGEKLNEIITGVKEKYETAKEEAVHLAKNGRAMVDEVKTVTQNGVK